MKIHILELWNNNRNTLYCIVLYCVVLCCVVLCCVVLCCVKDHCSYVHNISSCGENKA